MNYNGSGCTSFKVYEGTYPNCDMCEFRRTYVLFKCSKRYAIYADNNNITRNGNSGEMPVTSKYESNLWDCRDVVNLYVHRAFTKLHKSNTQHKRYSVHGEAVDDLSYYQFFDDEDTNRFHSTIGESKYILPYGNTHENIVCCPKVIQKYKN